MGDGLAYLESAFLTTIKKKQYLVFLRKDRGFGTLAEIAANPERKATQNTLSIALGLAKPLALLEEHNLPHNNLSLDTIEYFQKNVILDLPLLPTIQQEMAAHGDSKEPENYKDHLKEQDGIKRDVRSYL
jgi:hypothetical protein